MEAKSLLTQNLHRWMRQTLINQRKLALRAGLGETAVRDILIGRSRRPRYATLERLAEALGCRVQDLVGESPIHPVTSSTDLSPSAGANFAGANFGGRDVPILGRAQGGLSGVLIISEDQRPIDWAYRPAQFQGVHEAYAVYAVGSSMEPAIQEGNLLWIHPGQPPRPGDWVLIQRHDTSAIIKELGRRTEKILEVVQYNPDKRIKIPWEDIKLVHLVTGIWRR